MRRCPARSSKFDGGIATRLDCVPFSIVVNQHGQRFYGNSFICDERGDILAEFGAEDTGVLVATLDLAAAKKHRAAFGFFRDRRPELYGRLVEDL